VRKAEKMGDSRISEEFAIQQELKWALDASVSDRSGQKSSLASRQVIGTVFMAVALNCSPCSLSLTHWPSATSHSPAVTEGNDPMTVVSSRFPFVFNAQDAETAFVAVESNPLDDARDFFRLRSSVRDCGIHARGAIFTRMV